MICGRSESIFWVRRSRTTTKGNLPCADIVGSLFPSSKDTEVPLRWYYRALRDRLKSVRGRRNRTAERETHDETG